MNTHLWFSFLMSLLWEMVGYLCVKDVFLVSVVARLRLSRYPPNHSLPKLFCLVGVEVSNASERRPSEAFCGHL
jgi:hypothetical protein